MIRTALIIFMALAAAPQLDRTVAALEQLSGRATARAEYDATVDRGRRRAPTTKLYSEDEHLRPGDRRKLIATARDLRRNFALARWAINKHLDYVASFTFQAKTPDRNLNQQLEERMRAYSRKENSDVTARHNLPRMIRLAEAMRCVDGDFFFLKLSSGRLQALEGDRIQTPTDLPRTFDADDYTHGIQTTASGRPLRYVVCNRTKRGRGFEFHRVIPARHIIPHGFYDRFDQVRGISPIASAMNTFRDCYEGFEYALAKLKISQLFGLKIKRNADDDLPGATNEGSDADPEPYSVDFSRGPIVLDMDPGDDAEFLNNGTPPTELQTFLQQVIQLSLKSLDIPFSFYQEDFTNFFGSRAALQQYLKSCNSKRADLVDVLDEYTAWRFRLGILDGDVRLPAGMTLADVRWEWIPAGVPWWDPAKEVRGEVMAIHAGLATRTQVLKERGLGDFRDVVDQLADEEAYIREKNVSIVAPGPSIFAPDGFVQPGSDSNSNTGGGGEGNDA